MENFKNNIFPILVTALLFILVLQQCSNSSKTKYLVDRVDSIEHTQTIMSEELPTVDDVKLIYKIEGLEISKRILYDQNAIVRQKTRPDDRMNEYDKEIKSLMGK